MFSCAFVLLALFSATQGRAVNISNTWVLPEEGFPVFYRYFRDRISWYEADAVCQFHHANLVTVDTTAQYDAVRAYLKELDISSAVWVGLIRSNPEGDFTWTDYHGLTGDGYWSSAPDVRAAPLCAAADPAADYRWEARPCGGPTVASFICELPVPQWALGSQGCMVRSLPALTVLYLPESAAVQLTADCGLAGTRRVHCTGNIKREDLLKNISCTEDSSTSNILSIGTSWSTTDTSFTDQEMTNDATTEDISSTEHKDTKASEEQTTQVPKKYSVVLNNSPMKPQSLLEQLTQHYLTKDMHLNILHENNVESNDIPQNVKGDTLFTEEQSERLEDEKHIHYKMLHDALAKHGNLENIFTQPTDHFVPPLVMAKAKISDDMTVLSLAEKHAQQLAEERLARYNKHDSIIRPLQNSKVQSTTTTPSTVVEKSPIIVAIQSKKILEYEKKDKVKPILKKHGKKYDDPKRHSNIDKKLNKIDQISQTSTASHNAVDITTKLPLTPLNIEMSTVGDSSLDLTVMLKELGMENNTAPLFTSRSGHIPIQEVLFKEPIIYNTLTTDLASLGTPTSQIKSTLEPVTFNYDITDVTFTGDDKFTIRNHSRFEVTTELPDLKDRPLLKKLLADHYNLLSNYNAVTHIDTTVKINTTPSATDTQRSTYTTTKIPKTSEISTSIITDSGTFYTLPAASTTEKIMTVKTDNPNNPVIADEASQSDTILDSLMMNYTIITSEERNKTQTNSSEITPSLNNTQILVSEKVLHDNGEIVTETRYVNTKDDAGLNFTLSHEDNEKGLNDTSEEAIDDFQSPLLSAANEPLHKPNRSRRPQKPHLNKFNPFRILG